MDFTFEIETDDAGQAYVTVRGGDVQAMIYGPMPQAATGPFINTMKAIIKDTSAKLLAEILEDARQAKNEAGT